MKVKVMSDIHLEFGDFDPGSGDVLVLAGDICVVSDYDKFHSFFERCVNGYNKVFYVLGNHEHYNGNFDESYMILQSKLPDGITLLQNKSIFYRGVHFVGSTLWTNQNNLSYDTMSQSQSCMNDYYCVNRSDGRGLTVLDTVDDHLFTREWFEQAVPTLNGPVFLITHHAPSVDSVKGRYVGNEGAYSSDMTDFIKKNTNIQWWCHGHIHENNDYMVGECRVVANPRGYHGMELNPNFNPDFEIEIEE